ncbi:Gfo/Idh/MocA family oxidoreductase [Verrucomicrobia bacterium]|jgi:predicted dehydrogenase|nr:Gfo/Idh/MocA family oxidoreductase [Verrucomicrobiota bacterium]
MDSKVRWGIIGTGRIAHQFAAGLEHSETGVLHSVGSRSQDSARAFGNEFKISRCYGTYEELVEDSEIDVVYVATPHSFHSENSMLALNAGKAVLCEKPFTLTAAEARGVVACARSKNQFLMEAMWNRFFPAMTRLRQMLNDGIVGEIKMIEADFGFRSNRTEEPLLFDLNYGGGSLLDVGVYGVSLASQLLGPPTKVTSVGSIGPSGVDEQCAAILSYQGGQLAVIKSSIISETPQEATIIGADGTIRIESPFWCPKTLTLIQGEAAKTRVEVPFVGNGYQYEADEVGRCLRAGQSESELMPLDESLRIMETMDTIKARWRE